MSDIVGHTAAGCAHSDDPPVYGPEIRFTATKVSRHSSNKRVSPAWLPSEVRRPSRCAAEICERGDANVPSTSGSAFDLLCACHRVDVLWRFLRDAPQHYRATSRSEGRRRRDGDVFRDRDGQYVSQLSMDGERDDDCRSDLRQLHHSARRAGRQSLHVCGGGQQSIRQRDQQRCDLDGAGGTVKKRGPRAPVNAMEAAGFTVNPEDCGDWRLYPTMNVPFERLTARVAN